MVAAGLLQIPERLARGVRIQARDGQPDDIDCGWDTNGSADVAFVDRVDSVLGCEVAKRP